MEKCVVVGIIPATGLIVAGFCPGICCNDGVPKAQCGTTGVSHVLQVSCPHMESPLPRGLGVVVKTAWLRSDDRPASEPGCVT